jgi:hypothetical protein
MPTTTPAAPTASLEATTPAPFSCWNGARHRWATDSLVDLARSGNGISGSFEAL